MLNIQEIAMHRNGIGGAPFHVVTFTDTAGTLFVAVVFDADTPDARDMRTAVFDRTLLGKGIIEFGENSWRGDNYDRELRVAIKDWSTHR